MAAINTFARVPTIPFRRMTICVSETIYILITSYSRHIRLFPEVRLYIHKYILQVTFD